MERYIFNNKEKLKGKKAIENLFRSGYSFTSPPFRLIFKEIKEGSSPARMTVAVPKRLVKRAVDRNLIKRRTREAYRRNKTALYKIIIEKNLHFDILFIYQSEEVAAFNAIHNAVVALIYRLTEKIVSNKENFYL
jgi:ribonuclease P protein component